MSLNVKVPGGWVGTRSVGVVVGPVGVGKSYKRRRRNENELVDGVNAIVWLVVVLARIVWFPVRWLIVMPLAFVFRMNPAARARRAVKNEQKRLERLVLQRFRFEQKQASGPGRR